MATDQLAPQLRDARGDTTRCRSTASTTWSSTSGNAAQAAFYLTRAFGFTETAYAGLETGRRDRVSHVLEQGRIRLVLTGTLSGEDEIGEHHKRHGDGVHKIALSVPDAEAAYRHAVEHGARGVTTPHWIEDEHGRVRLVVRGHLRRHAPPVRGARRLPRRRSCPGFEARGDGAGGPAASPASTTWSATSSSATWRSGSATTSASSA